MGNAEAKNKSRKLYEKVLSDEKTNDDIRKILLIHEERHPNSKIDKIEFAHMYEDFKRVQYQYKPITNMYYVISLEKISEFVFRIFDVNRDGYISLEEYYTAAQLLSEANAEDKLEYAFEAFDYDCDGSLNKEEIKAGIIAMLDILGSHKTSTFIDELLDECIKELDFNRDGKITKKEFVRILKQNPKLRALMTPFDCPTISMT